MATICTLCRGTGWQIVHRNDQDVALPCPCRQIARSTPAHHPQPPPHLGGGAGEVSPAPLAGKNGEGAQPLTLKQQGLAYRRACRQFANYERAVRDLLLLCLPRVTFERHLDALQVIQGWFAQRTFEHDRRPYPFNPEHFKQAVETLWSGSFTPNGKSDATATLNYLKKTMITLAAQDVQAAQERASQLHKIESVGDVLTQLQQRRPAA